MISIPDCCVLKTAMVRQQKSKNFKTGNGERITSIYVDIFFTLGLAPCTHAQLRIYEGLNGGGGGGGNIYVGLSFFFFIMQSS